MKYMKLTHHIKEYIDKQAQDFLDNSPEQVAKNAKKNKKDYISHFFFSIGMALLSLSLFWLLDGGFIFKNIFLMMIGLFFIICITIFSIVLFFESISLFFDGEYKKAIKSCGNLLIDDNEFSDKEKRKIVIMLEFLNDIDCEYSFSQENGIKLSDLVFLKKAIENMDCSDKSSHFNHMVTQQTLMNNTNANNQINN